MLRLRDIKEFATTLTPAGHGYAEPLVFPPPYDTILKSDGIIELFFPAGLVALSNYLKDVHDYLVGAITLEDWSFSELFDRVNGTKVDPKPSACMDKVVIKNPPDIQIRTFEPPDTAPDPTKIVLDTGTLMEPVEGQAIRKFDTGATRDTDDGKFDLEGFLSPLVLERYAEYMHKNRLQSDGKLRDSDNWQKGIPKDAYMKSLYRHFFDTWKEHRSLDTEAGIESALCGVIFNAMGYLHELLKGKSNDSK